MDFQNGTGKEQNNILIFQDMQGQLHVRYKEMKGKNSLGGENAHQEFGRTLSRDKGMLRRSRMANI